MTLIAHPDRDNVWVKPGLIKPEWTKQEWTRVETGFEFLSTEPGWKPARGSGETESSDAGAGRASWFWQGR
jgi:hypothetical protein